MRTSGTRSIKRLKAEKGKKEEGRNLRRRSRTKKAPWSCGGGIVISRFKGLGEMNPEQLWSTTMNPDTRTILQVSIENAADADRTFSILMGDEVEPRREFIEKNAKYVRNLDV